MPTWLIVRNSIQVVPVNQQLLVNAAGWTMRTRLNGKSALLIDFNGRGLNKKGTGVNKIKMRRSFSSPRSSYTFPRFRSAEILKTLISWALGALSCNNDCTLRKAQRGNLTHLPLFSSYYNESVPAPRASFTLIMRRTREQRASAGSQVWNTR